MGFFDDLAMGFGQKPKTKDYEARTARTMGRTDPQGAERYMASRGVTSADIGNMSPSSYVGYQSLSDMFDGGGPARSGARFSSQNTAAFDTNKDGNVSEKEYVSAETAMPDVFSQTQGGIASLSNAFGARPRGSYAQERGLGAEGINIGTSGIADYFAGQGMLGNIVRGGAPSSLQRAEPNVPIGNSLDPSAVQTFNELAPDQISLFERMTQGNTGPNFVMSTQNSDNSAPEPEPEIISDIIPKAPIIHIAPLPRRAGGGLVSLVRR
ncbi:MAG: hypothetical protein ACPHEP_06500 [Acidimicrobiales bacterium]